MLMSEKEYNSRLIKKQYRGTFFGALVVLLLDRYSDLRCDKSEIDDGSFVAQFFSLPKLSKDSIK